MKNFKVIFDVDGKQVVAHYETLAQATTVANSTTKVLGIAAKVISKALKKVGRKVKSMFTKQQLQDFDAALLIIEKVACVSCGYCQASYDWAMSVKQYFMNKLNIRY